MEGELNDYYGVKHKNFSLFCKRETVYNIKI